MSQKRVAFITQSAKPSGAELYLLRITEVLQSLDAIVVLGEAGVMASALQDRGVRVLVIEQPAALRQLRRGSRPSLLRVLVTLPFAVHHALRIRRCLRLERIELVYSISAKAHIWGAIATIWSKRAFIVHLHDTVPANLSGAVLRAVVTGFASAIFANSLFTASTLRSRRHIIVQPCPVPWEIDAAPRTLTAMPARLAMVGRIARWKGQIVALKAVERLLQQRGKESVVLVLAGTAMFKGDDDYLAELQQFVNDSGIGLLVSFAGHVDDPRSVYQKCDVLLHCSIEPEPFGQVIVEAMSEGVVVCASAAGGPQELVRHGENGFLYPPGDVEALVTCIETVLDDPERVARMSASAITTAVSYSLPPIVEKLEKDVVRVRRR